MVNWSFIYQLSVAWSMFCMLYWYVLIWSINFNDFTFQVEFLKYHPPVSENLKKLKANFRATHSYRQKGIKEHNPSVTEMFADWPRYRDMPELVRFRYASFLIYIKGNHLAKYQSKLLPQVALLKCYFPIEPNVFMKYKYIYTGVQKYMSLKFGKYTGYIFCEHIIRNLPRRLHRLHYFNLKVVDSNRFECLQ